MGYVKFSPFYTWVSSWARIYIKVYLTSRQGLFHCTLKLPNYFMNKETESQRAIVIQQSTPDFMSFNTFNSILWPQIYSPTLSFQVSPPLSLFLAFSWQKKVKIPSLAIRASAQFGTNLPHIVPHPCSVKAGLWAGPVFAFLLHFQDWAFLLAMIKIHIYKQIIYLYTDKDVLALNTKRFVTEVYITVKSENNVHGQPQDTLRSMYFYSVD